MLPQPHRILDDRAGRPRRGGGEGGPAGRIVIGVAVGAQGSGDPRAGRQLIEQLSQPAGKRLLMFGDCAVGDRQAGDRRDGAAGGSGDHLQGRSGLAPAHGGELG